MNLSRKHYEPLIKDVFEYISRIMIIEFFNWLLMRKKPFSSGTILMLIYRIIAYAVYYLILEDLIIKMINKYYDEKNEKQ